MRLEIAEGSEAAYSVREQLAGRSLPSDAVGTTRAVKGMLILGSDNAVRSERSKITVDLRTLTSDEDRRDRYVKDNTLQTRRFPLVEFVPQGLLGLPFPLPSSGEAGFRVVGDMTLHGVTRPITWEVSARFVGDEVTGRATTSFKFGDFGMTVPKLFVVLSVDDNIQLRLDFRLSRSS